MTVAIIAAAVFALVAIYMFISCQALTAENEKLEAENASLRVALELAQRGADDRN